MAENNKRFKSTERLKQNKGEELKWAGVIKKKENLSATMYKYAIQKQLINFLINILFYPAATVLLWRPFSWVALSCLFSPFLWSFFPPLADRSFPLHCFATPAVLAVRQGANVIEVGKGGRGITGRDLG